MSEERKLDQLKRVEEELKCVICARLIDDAHSLMCGHNFCGQCIIQWFNNKKSCPTCRTPALKQPIPNITLQKIAEILWPSDIVPDTKLQRADWLTLYPVQNQGSYIRDEDGEGVIYRCSNCAWELDEELFCGQCLISYEDDSGNRGSNNNDRDDLEEVSDTESHREDEEDLEGFVVDDEDEIDYENTENDHVFDDETDSDNNSPSEIDDSSSDEEDGPRKRYRGIKRRRIVINDDDDEREVISIDEEEDDQPLMLSEEDGSEMYDNEEDDDISNSHPRNPYIVHSADEDEEERRPKPKLDRVLENIANARVKMEANILQANSSTARTQNNNDADSTSSSSDDEPDYSF